MQKVLFLCTGNSARSQLAEGLVNHYLGDQWEARSAGTRPTGYVHPLAIQALEAVGIHHEGRSKSLDEFQGTRFDLVITVCDAAAEECPLWLGQGKRIHNGYPDPAKTEGDDTKRLTAFCKVRDEMIRDILPLLSQYS